MNEMEGYETGKRETPKIAALWGALLLAISAISVFLLMMSPVKEAKAELIQSASNLNSEAITAGGNLTITKTHSGVFPIGGTGVYTIRVRNAGTDTVTGTITVADTLPAGLTYNSMSGTGWDTCIGSGQNATCVYSNTLGITPTLILPPLLLTVNVAYPGVMVVTNTATLANANEITTTDNLARDRTDLAPADLAVTKTATPNLVGEGGVFTYTLTVVNNGPSATTNVVLTDTLPANIIYISHTASQGTYTTANGRWVVGALGNVGPGNTATLTIRGRVRSGIGATSITNIAQVSSDVRDNNPGNNQVSTPITTQARADLLVTKNNFCDIVAPGDTISYTVYISNTGTNPASTVFITDTFPSYVTYVSDNFVSRGFTLVSSSSTSRVWSIANLIAGEFKRPYIQFRATSPLPNGTTSVANSIIGKTASQEADQDNNYTSDADTVIEAPSLSITKSVSPSEARVNQSFTFSIVVRNNNGSRAMTNVVIRDSFSSYLNISSVSRTQGTHSIDSTSRTVTVDLGTLNPLQSATITIVVVVNSSTTSTVSLSNQANATYRYGCYAYSGSSNSVSFRIIGSSSTLPGTGYSQKSYGRERDNKLTGGFWAALISALLIGIAGLFALGFGILAKVKNSEWSGWSIRMGLVLSGLAVLFGLAAWGLSNPGNFNLWETVGEQTTEVAVLPESPATPINLVLVNSPGGFQNHETLPDYPIPTPTIPPSMTDEPADTTPPVRILIPELDLDTEVKYVPFDGYSWLIQGLQWEVAWMGDTSWPGLGGNTSIAGHVTLRNGSNGPFRFIENLGQGSEIVLQTEKNLYHYKVTAKRVVESSDLSVISPTEVSTLTLITCTDWDTNLKVYLKRLIVLAELEEVVPLAANVGG